MDKTITRGPDTLFYRDEGSGPPVVLLHGFAEDGSIWDNQVEQLRESYRLLIPDLAGSGRSSVVAGEASSPQTGDVSSSHTGDASSSQKGEASSPLPIHTSMEKMADDLLLILDREGIRETVLIGHSMGGYISLAVAEKYPERLKAIGLFHSTAYADTEEKKTARRKSIEFIQKNGSAAFIRQSTPNLFAPETRTGQPQLIEEMIRRYSGFSPDSLIDYYEAMIRRPDRTAILERFQNPVLFVIGSHDQAVPPQQALQQSHIPALSHIHLLEHSGHAGMLEEPDRSCRILRSFLNFVTHS